MRQERGLEAAERCGGSGLLNALFLPCNSAAFSAFSESARGWLQPVGFGAAGFSLGFKNIRPKKSAPQPLTPIV